VSPAAASHEKDVETMPTQKIFKGRVRARMAKTGESYTAARRQLLHKADAGAIAPEPIAPEVPNAPEAPERPTSADAPDAIPDGALLVADEAMQRATGKGHAEWFAILDDWGATEHTHTEIAKWLSETHGFPGWWVQNVTVAYERARGMRAPHQMRDGFSISVTRTITTDSSRALAAFIDEAARGQWLPDATLRQRPTRAALSARFDWAEPRSRLVVTVVPKAPDKALVSIAHEQLPDADSAARLKAAWREWLAALKEFLEGA
jgi:hypothetical protein